jgi:hypothetical protein
VEIRRDDGAAVAFRPAERDRSVWQVGPRLVVEPEQTTVVGRLEMVDLGKHRFRIADDVGNQITLDHVEDEAAVSSLIGQRTSATGLPTRDPQGRVVSVSAPALERVDDPTGWDGLTNTPWQFPPDTAGPDPFGGADFDDDEWDAFMSAVKGS